MPRITVWALRAALISLLAGFTLGALMLANKGQPFWPQAWQLLPAHIELLLAGWLAQLALGVAYWILPRFSGGSRGSPTLAAAAVLLLNLGAWLAALQLLLPPLLLAGRACQALAGILFALHAWRRIRPLSPG
jgi:hypothetical protein